MRKFTRRQGWADEPALVAQRAPDGVASVFQAIAEARADQRDALPACEVAGRTLAANGADLAEALEGLQQTCLTYGGPATFEEIRSLSVAWSEETLAYLHQISCEDPLTGVSSLAHVRARLAEVYRGEERRGRSAADSYALVVIEQCGTSHEHGFERALHLSRLADTVRVVFQGSETIGRAGTHRLIVLTKRPSALGEQVALVERLLRERFDAHSCRVWIEGLPTTDEAAARVLDELARS